MQLGVRSRILLWLGATVLPIVAIGAFAASVMEDRLADRVETELTNILGLEAARIGRELDALTTHTEELAARAGTQSVIADVRPSGSTDRPLDQMADALVYDLSDGNKDAAAVVLLDADGAVLGASSAADRIPTPDQVVAGSTFASAYRSAPGDDRLPVQASIVADDGTLLGLLAVDWNIAPITDLLVTHEGFGETSEAHIAQPTAEGDAAFITLLRFERDAAFTKVIPGTLDVPIVNALSSPEPTVVHAPDYRKEPSVLAFQTIEQTGWALVVKIDQSEALGATRVIRTAILGSLALLLFSIVAGWALVLRPLLRRLRRTATAAERIAGGEYEEPIADAGSDEIAEMARSIDQLAHDLAVDIERRSAVEAQLLHQATHDQLTGVSNRQQAEVELRSHLDELEPDRSTSLLFLDLDGFKEVNDTWGHAVGDEILVEVARRLTDAVPADATVARWGGDEFVVVLPDHDEDEAAVVAEMVHTMFSKPFATTIGDHPMGASIGAATASGRASSVDELIHLADGRMFSAKQNHRRAKILSSETARLVEAALSENRVESWLQPIVCMEPDGETTTIGVEALARIRTPDGAVVEPGEFLAELQSTRFARLLDMRVAELTLSELADWRRHGLVDDGFVVALNLSPASLVHANLTADLRNVMHRYEIDPSQIVLELSEQLADPNQTTIATLRDEGFVLALDDFGLKHSNLDRLFTSGATQVKLDHRWSADYDVLAGLARTCSAKGIDLIVQGVETAEQARAILAHGVTCVQGYHFGRPQPPAMLAVSLDARRRSNKPGRLAQPTTS